MKNNIFIPKKVIDLSGNCLFGFVKLPKNADLDKCKYSGYSISFHCRSELLFTEGRYRKNFITFGVDMRSSVHVNNKGKYILIQHRQKILLILHN